MFTKDRLRIGGFTVGKVKLSVEVEAELRRRVKIAAATRDLSIRDWLVGAIRHELLAGDEGQEHYPAEGPKPTGLEDAPRPKSGHTVADAVIEDRR